MLFECFPLHASLANVRYLQGGDILLAALDKNADANMQVREGVCAAVLQLKFRLFSSWATDNCARSLAQLHR